MDDAVLALNCSPSSSQHRRGTTPLICRTPPSALFLSLSLLSLAVVQAMNMCLNSALRVGSTVVTMPKFDPVPFLETMAKHKVTFAPLVPPIIAFLAVRSSRLCSAAAATAAAWPSHVPSLFFDVSELPSVAFSSPCPSPRPARPHALPPLQRHPVVSKFDLSSLRVIFSGAAPLDAETQKAVELRLPGARSCQGYGMSEASREFLVVFSASDAGALQRETILVAERAPIVPSSATSLILPSSHPPIVPSS